MCLYVFAGNLVNFVGQTTEHMAKATVEKNLLKPFPLRKPCVGDSCALCLFWRLRNCETSSLLKFVLIVVDGGTAASFSRVISLSYGMLWVGRNLKDDLLSISPTMGRGLLL